MLLRDCANDIRLLLSRADEQNSFAIRKVGEVFVRQIILAVSSFEADQRDGIGFRKGFNGDDNLRSILSSDSTSSVVWLSIAIRPDGACFV